MSERFLIGGLRGKLQYGLDTLHSASEDVAKLQVDLTQKQPRLVETQHEVEETMVQILIDKKDAAVTKEVVEKLSVRRSNRPPMIGRSRLTRAAEALTARPVVFTRSPPACVSGRG